MRNGRFPNFHRTFALGSFDRFVSLSWRSKWGSILPSRIRRIKERVLSIVEVGSLVSVPAIIVGLIFLLADLGNPLRSINVFSNVQSSIMTWGSIIILLFTLVGLFYSSFWFDIKIGRTRLFPWRNNLSLRKTTAETGLILALATMILHGPPARGCAWKTALGFTIDSSSLCDKRVVVRCRSYCDYGRCRTTRQGSSFSRDGACSQVGYYVIVLEIAVVTALLGTVMATSFTGMGSVTAIVTGPYSLLFWGGLIVLGFLIPLGLQMYADSKKRNVISEILVSSFAVAISGFVLRYLIISTGYSTPIPYVSNFFQLVQVSPPTMSDYIVTLGLFVLLALVYLVGSVFLRSQESKPRSIVSEAKAPPPKTK